MKESDSIVNREIEVIDQDSHILMRPTMYVGAVNPQEEKIQIVENGKLVFKQKNYSVGFYKILDEVIDNAIDEAKRCYAQDYLMKEINISINTETNLATVKDTGMGFHNGLKINKKSGLNNIETAMSNLRAGSNFKNDETEVSLIGTNGVGVSCTNVLSDYFKIQTSDGTYEYTQVWEKFVTTEREEVKTKSSKKGTTISFIPRQEIFKNQKWDSEIIISKLTFREFTRSQSKELSSLKLTLEIDGKKIDLTKPFIPEESVYFENKHVKLWVWTDFADSANISFVNGAVCTGIHQKLAQEWINKNIFEKFEKAHYFYKTCIVMNLPPKKVLFGDQNKTKFVGLRDDLESLYQFKLTKKEFFEIAKTKFYLNTIEKIYNSMQRENINVIKKAKKERSKKISDKYFASQVKDSIFICEGNSAAGSLNQARDPKTHAVYTLKGKIKNAKSLQDLSENAEIIDLMNILNLEVNDLGVNCKWKRVIIATDADCDGAHIASLIINLFYLWFPKVIESGKLFILQTPLVSVDDSKKNRTYYSSLEEFGKAKNKKNPRYLKGLGSLSPEDWEYVFKNPDLLRVYTDSKSERSMKVAFGPDVNLRKRWLTK